MATCATSQATPVAASARCVHIDRLREEAKHLQEKLRLSRQQARQHEKQDRRDGSRSTHSNDYELFLQRKIQKNSLRIAHHIAEHGCEKLGHDRD
ncbi:MAG TPA: hypothetical protein VMS96_02265 [Terriglobales bacterium]|nr:hypothetical protein [Terriglobales bacterium]